MPPEQVYKIKYGEILHPDKIKQSCKDHDVAFSQALTAEQEDWDKDAIGCVILIHNRYLRKYVEENRQMHYNIFFSQFKTYFDDLPQAFRNDVDFISKLCYKYSRLPINDSDVEIFKTLFCVSKQYFIEHRIDTRDTLLMEYCDLIMDLCMKEQKLFLDEEFYNKLKKYAGLMK
ncbi:hypothetical protein AKO1_001755 [Acrasis kona]|uniref:Uncharacterized protein n=1 Tax=Acrasis kona TaxID=1008807 RepID=A0AAW2ZBV0_9EUKA